MPANRVEYLCAVFLCLPAVGQRKVVFVQQKGAFTRRYKDERRQIAAKRANELRTEIADYLKAGSYSYRFHLAERTAAKKRLLSILRD